MRKITGRARDETGFSLVEQMVALTILSIIMIGIFPVLTAGMLQVKNNDFKMRATTVGQEMLEASRGVPFTELIDGTYTPDNPPSVSSSPALRTSYDSFLAKIQDSTYIPGGYGQLIVRSTAFTTSADIKEMVVTVRWDQAGLTKEFTSSTYRQNYLTTQ